MRTFDDLYLRPNGEGGGHFVYNINTMQRNSDDRVIGVNNKPIPMTQLTLDTINRQGKEEDQPEGIIFGDINMETTVSDLDASPDEVNPQFNNVNADDKSYLTSDDSPV